MRAERILETQRLTLRGFRTGDMEGLYRQLSDPDVMRQESTTEHFGLEHNVYAISR